MPTIVVLIDPTLLVPCSKIAKEKAILLNSSQVQVCTKVNEIESGVIGTLLVPVANIPWDSDCSGWG